MASIKNYVRALSYEHDQQMIGENLNPEKLRKEFYFKYTNTKDQKMYNKKTAKWEPLDQCDFYQQSYYAENGDITERITTSIYDLVKKETGMVSNDDLFIVRFKSERTHHVGACWCCSTTTDIERFIAFYVKDDKIYCKLIDLENYTSGIMGDNEYRDPVLSDKPPPSLGQIFEVFGSLVEPMIQRYGTDLVIKEL